MSLISKLRKRMLGFKYSLRYFGSARENTVILGQVNRSTQGRQIETNLFVIYLCAD